MSDDVTHRFRTAQACSCGAIATPDGLAQHIMAANSILILDALHDLCDAVEELVDQLRPD